MSSIIRPSACAAVPAIEATPGLKWTRPRALAAADLASSLSPAASAIRISGTSSVTSSGNSGTTNSRSSSPMTLR
jgi:hypothetical protein